MSRVIILAVILSGCTAQTATPGLPDALPDAIAPAIIYSLGSAREIAEQPYYDNIEPGDLASSEGYLKIIDKANVSTMADVQSYIDTINGGLGEPEELAMCFEPRHAITYPSEYGEVTALICFDCNRALISIDGWIKSVHFVSEPRAQLESLYEKYHVTKPIKP